MAYKTNDECLLKAAENEPIFVLRAQDKLAPVIVRMWADLARLHGAPRAKVHEARDTAALMQKWAKDYGDKWPD